MVLCQLAYRRRPRRRATLRTGRAPLGGAALTAEDHMLGKIDKDQGAGRGRADTQGTEPGSAAAIALVRERCRRLVRRRAMVSAGVSAVPIPGLDVVSDLGMFARLIEEVNREFGLTHEQVERLHPKFKLIAYEAAVGVGGMMVGKLITRELMLQLLKRAGVKAAARQASKLVPLAGQLVSAAIGFVAFRQIGYQHVDACAVVARELLVARPGGAG